MAKKAAGKAAAKKPKKNAAAVRLAKLRMKKLTPEERSATASLGGTARSKKLTKKRRSEIAREAARARWDA